MELRYAIAKFLSERDGDASWNELLGRITEDAIASDAVVSAAPSASSSSSCVTTAPAVVSSHSLVAPEEAALDEEQLVALAPVSVDETMTAEEAFPDDVSDDVVDVD